MTNTTNKIALIAAMDSNGGIGYKGGMPWHNREELRHFRLATTGRVLIVGSRTADSLINLQGDFEDKVYSPEEQIVLKGRKIIVVTSKAHVREYVRLGLYVERSLEDAITKAVELRGEDDTQAIYLAGGGMLYKEALEKDLINTMLLSSIHDGHLCDTHFPDFDRDAWIAYEMLAEPTFTVNLYTKKETQDEPVLYSS